MDDFTVTVQELREWLADKPGTSHVVITPPSGASFPLLGWCEPITKDRVVLTGVAGAYDTA